MKIFLKCVIIMADTAASTAEVTAPSMMELESVQVLDDIGDKPKSTSIKFLKQNFGQAKPVLDACNRHGFKNGHGCIMTKLKIRFFVTLVAKL